MRSTKLFFNITLLLSAPDNSKKALLPGKGKQPSIKTSLTFSILSKAASAKGLELRILDKYNSAASLHCTIGPFWVSMHILRN